MTTLPDEIRSIIGEYELIADTTGYSGTDVYRVDGPEAMYLKVARDPKNIEELQHEVVLLEWLADRISVPKVIVKSNQALLMTAVTGIPSSDAIHHRLEDTIILLAQGLRSIHDIDITDCPYDECLDVKLTAARCYVDNNIVDEDDFGDDVDGLTAQQVLDKLLVSRPPIEQSVFTHGDYCLPNIMIGEGTISGFIDWGRGGISDQYQDFALALRSLRYNLEHLGSIAWSPRYVNLFLDAYGMDSSDFDYEKATYYRLLDELF